MHRRDRAGHHASRRRSIHFRQRRLSRLGQSTVRSSRDDGPRRRLAQDFARLGTSIERRLDRPRCRDACAAARGTSAIDWHLQPYYGQPFQSRNEIYYGQPKLGTAKFHAYATACIVEYGHRYTLVLTWVRRHESMVRVLRRMVARIREIGLKIRRVLLDRAFFNGAVVAFLQEEKLPFVMPVVIRGRAPKKGRTPTGLRWIKRQPAGWYPHVMKHEKQPVKISVCVGYRRHRNRKDGKQRHQKLLFAAWRVHGSPTEIRELYRLRFGIETSYRQMRQARIYTCTRNPRLRLFFLAVALILRNLWVWIHHIRLAKDRATP